MPSRCRRLQIVTHTGNISGIHCEYSILRRVCQVGFCRFFTNTSRAIPGPVRTLGYTLSAAKRSAPRRSAPMRLAPCRLPPRRMAPASLAPCRSRPRRSWPCRSSRCAPGKSPLLQLPSSPSGQLLAAYSCPSGRVVPCSDPAWESCACVMVAPVSRAPHRSAPVRLAPDRSAPRRFASRRFVPARPARIRIASWRLARLAVCFSLRRSQSGSGCWRARRSPSSLTSSGRRV